MSQIIEYLLKTPEGLELCLLNYGARVHSVNLPLNEKFIKVTLGYKELEDYFSDKFYMGATVGRFCNRIHGGEITLNQKSFKLPMNEAEHANTLHGGFTGFDKCFWEVIEKTETSIEFKLLSPHLDQGFPGNLEVRARYCVEGLGFSVEYSAVCNQDTLVNLCNHTYFNLADFDADKANSIADHQLLLQADKFLPLNENKAPEGIIQSVTGMPFDFLNSSESQYGPLISMALNSEHPQIKQAGGLDHTFIHNTDENKKIKKVAQLYCKQSNIVLSVSTNQTATHVYSGNYLDGQFNKQTGICFETQGFPDSPNHENFPSAQLKAGDIYSHKTTYEFSLC